jgi:hypothetical protein
MTGPVVGTTRVEAIRARAAAATAGPWRWFGNTAVDSVYLGTDHSGRLFLLRPDLRYVESVYHHEHVESYTVEQARESIRDWCGAHDGEDGRSCRCDELREFLTGTMYHDEPGRSLCRDGVDVWLERGVFVKPDLSVQRDHRMVSYRDVARYEVLGGRTIAEHQAAGGQINGQRRDLYREDIVGLDNADAEFMAAARQDVDDLLAEVDQLRERAEAAERELALIIEGAVPE